MVFEVDFVIYVAELQTLWGEALSCTNSHLERMSQVHTNHLIKNLVKRWALAIELCFILFCWNL